MDPIFNGYAILVAPNGKQKEGSWFAHLDHLRFQERGVIAKIHYSGRVASAVMGSPELRLPWDAIESWTVQHGFAKSPILRTPRSQTIVQSRDGASITFVNKTVDAETMTDIARGQLPTESINEDARSSEPRSLPVLLTEAEERTARRRAMAFLVGALLVFGASFRWFATDSDGDVPRIVVAGVVFGGIACIVAFVGLVEMIRSKRRDT